MPEGGVSVHEIAVTVNGHAISAKAPGDAIVSGTSEHWSLRTEFDGEWSVLAKRVTFSCAGTDVTCAYEDGMAVPWEAIAHDGALRLSFVGVGVDGTEVVRTERMRDGLRVVPCGADMGDEALEATEDVAHAARRELDRLSSAVDDAHEAISNARESAKSASDAASTASSAARKAELAADEAFTASRNASSAAETASLAGEKALVASETADKSAKAADAAASSARGELDLMLGNPRDDEMWLYATGVEPGSSSTPALDNVEDSEMMGYVRRDV